MKKIKLEKVLLLLVLGLTIISCSKDETPQTSSADVVGVWNCSSVDYTGSTVTEFLGQSMTADFIGEGYDVDFTFTLSENPNVASSNGSYSIKLTTTTLGQTIDQNIENIAFTYVGTWSMADNKISITSEGETSVATIVELTDTVLKLNILEESTTSNNGATVTSTVDTHMTFVK
ncbi:MAG: hypothetical protein QM503_05680 [Bacteroidota bacterium]